MRASPRAPARLPAETAAAKVAATKVPATEIAAVKTARAMRYFRSRPHRHMRPRTATRRPRSATRRPSAIWPRRMMARPRIRSRPLPGLARWHQPGIGVTGDEGRIVIIGRIAPAIAHADTRFDDTTRQHCRDSATTENFQQFRNQSSPPCDRLEPFNPEDI